MTAVSDKKRRKVNWHRLHSFFGLTTSLFLGFLFLTGTLLVFAPEIDWLISRDMRAAPQDGGKLNWGQIYDAAASDRPGWSIVRIVRDDAADVGDKVVMLKPGSQEDHYIWVDPYRATVQGETSTRNFQNTVLTLHESLLIKGRKGKFVVTVFALPLAAAVIAGLLTYRRFWTGFFRMPRFGGRSRAVLSDLHRLIAVWSLVFLLPLTLTTGWYFLENIGFSAQTEMEHRTQKRPTLLPATFTGARLDEAAGIAREALPGLRITTVALPRMKFQPIVFQGQLTALLVRDRENSVHVDPVALTVLGVHRGEDLSLHQRIAAGADPVHYGTWGGTTTRILWFVFGLALTTLVGIGIAINAKRLAAMEEARSGAPTRASFGRSWRAMGPFGLGAWLSLALILWGLVRVLSAGVQF